MTKTTIVLAAALLLPCPLMARENPRVYQPDFASLEQAEPAPEWFKDAKFGIYFHWGVYCHRTLKPGQVGTVESRPLRVAAVSIVDRS